MKRKGGIHKGVTIGAYSILILVMLLLLGTVLRYPENHLISWQMILGVTAGTVILLFAGALWNKIYAVTGRRNSLYMAALILFGVLLYLVSLSRRGNENTLVDYMYVYQDAMNLATGKDLENTNYFLTYSNNLKPMLLLSVLFRMALTMDVFPFYFVLLRNVILVLLVACACGYLAERDGDCGSRGSAGRRMEDHGSHTADRVRGDPSVAESVCGPAHSVIVRNICGGSGNGRTYLGEYL